MWFAGSGLYGVIVAAPFSSDSLLNRPGFSLESEKGIV